MANQQHLTVQTTTDKEKKERDRAHMRTFKSIEMKRRIDY